MRGVRASFTATSGYSLSMPEASQCKSVCPNTRPEGLDLDRAERHSTRVARTA